jgi:hypothetical protein
MHRRNSGRFFAVLIFLGGLCLPLPAEDIHFVESYAGTHQAEFHDLLEQAKAIVPAALAYITGQWGLPNALHNPMIVMVMDSPTSDPSRPVSAYVRAVWRGPELRQELVIDLPHHLMYPGENLENVLYHEMAHAVLQDAAIGPSAAGIPQWFNEGLAQSVTTEGHERTQEDFKRYGHTDARAVVCDLNGNVDAFFHGEYNFGCYTYFYLAVRRLIARSGPAALPKIIVGLHNGIPLPTVIGQATPMDWAAFQQDAEQYAKDVFSGKEAIP